MKRLKMFECDYKIARSETLPIITILNEEETLTQIDEFINNLKISAIFISYWSFLGFEEPLIWKCSILGETKDVRYFQQFHCSEIAFKELMPDRIVELILSKKYTTLKVLHFSCKNILGISGPLFSQLLTENKIIQSIVMNSCIFTEGWAKDIADALSATQTLRRLHISSDALSKTGALVLLKAVLRNPYLSFDWLQIKSVMAPPDVVADIFHLGRQNERIVKILDGEAATVTNSFFCTENCLRFYSFTVTEMERELEKLRHKNSLTSITHVFIFGTLLTDSFKSKWFNGKRIGPNLECLTLINCTATDPVDPKDVDGGYFLRNILLFPKLKVINIVN